MTKKYFFILFIGFILMGCMQPTSTEVIKKRYIGKINSITKISKLDKYSKVFNHQENKVFHERLNGKYKGINSVFSLKLKQNILYARVKFFDRDTATYLRRFINQHKPMRGIILDLRNNPGGLLDEAIKVSDLFLSKGIIIRIVGKTEIDTQTYYADAYNTVSNAPMVVLVNKNTISASEIVTGVLQESKRAMVIGEKTFGKGTIQDVVKIDKNKFLKFTIANYYLADGNNIDKKGLMPDIQIKNGKITILSKGMYKELEQKILDIQSENDDIYLLVAQMLLSA